MGWSTFGSSFYLDYLHRLGWSSGTIGLVVATGSGKVLAASIYLLVSSLTGMFSALALGLGFAGLGLGLTPFLTSVPVIALVSGIYVWNRHQVSVAQDQPREGKVVQQP
jgi:sorbitol-specific phosphotransferase system component IIBC